jgi:hypothetical protein
MVTIGFKHQTYKMYPKRLCVEKDHHKSYKKSSCQMSIALSNGEFQRVLFQADKIIPRSIINYKRS